MEIESRALGEMTITGQISTYNDYERIKEEINDQMDRGASSLVVVVNDSKSIISSVVGVFMKVVNYNKIPLSIEVKEDSLLKILDNLGLKEVMNIKKV